MSLHAGWGLVQVFAEGRVTSGERSELRLLETGSICGFLTRTHREKTTFFGGGGLSMCDPRVQFQICVSSPEAEFVS